MQGAGARERRRQRLLANIAEKKKEYAEKKALNGSQNITTAQKDPIPASSSTVDIPKSTKLEKLKKKIEEKKKAAKTADALAFPEQTAEFPDITTTSTLQENLCQNVTDTDFSLIDCKKDFIIVWM